MRNCFEIRLSRENCGPRVKIALLDSGFDPTDPFIRGSSERIIQHHCLEQNSRANEDPKGHGTHILASLLKYAPFADLYVLRISDADSVDSADGVARVRYEVSISHQ